MSVIVEKTITNMSAVKDELFTVFGASSIIYKSIIDFNDSLKQPILTIPFVLDNASSTTSATIAEYDTVNLNHNNTAISRYSDSISTADYNKDYVHSGDIAINTISTITHPNSYEDFIKWALWILTNNIPSPIKFGELYNLSIGNTYVSIRFPNNISISANIYTTINSKDSIKYKLGITFHSTPICDPYVYESAEYKAAIANGWKERKEKKNENK